MTSDTGAMLIDCHLHAWDRRLLPYSWMDPDALPVASTVPPRSELDAGRTRAVILVEAGVDPAMRHRETEWMLAQVGHDVVGVIAAAGWQDVSLPPARAGIVGVRVNILGANEVKGAAALIAETCHAAAHSGWPVDVLCSPAEYALLTDVLDEVDDGVIVIDHLGRPAVEQGWLSAAAQDWVRSVEDFARHGGVRIKVSGPAGRSPDFAAAAIDLFGTRRCVLGSDWPMEREGGYADRIDHLIAATQGRLDDDLRAATARAVYSLA